MRNYYDITVIYNTGDINQVFRLAKLVKIYQYEENKKYEFDIVIRNSVWGKIPYNLKSKDNRYIEMRHANYKYLKEKGLLEQQYHKWDKINEIISCGEFVGKMSEEVMHDKPTPILNILAPRKKTNKILKLISCIRIDNDKGWDNMQILMKLLRKANIKFEWKIFTNNPQKCEYEEVHFYKQRFDIWDYIADSDYCVLLSKVEGLPYTIQEALQYQVPCIVSDIEGCTEMVKDGINGYVVPKDMKFDVNKLLNIPKCQVYDNKAKEKWIEYLGNAEYIEKEEKNMKQIVKARLRFNDLDAGIEREVGDTWEVSEERANQILLVDTPKGKLIEIVEVKEYKKNKADKEIKPISKKQKK